MPAQVRLATRSDAEKIALFQVLMAAETEDKVLDQASVATAVKAVFDDPNKGFYFVGEIDGQVISSLLITYEWSDWRNSNLWYIQSVFVEADNRGQGVFKKMYQTVVDQAKQNGVKHIRLYVENDNDRAQKVYQSLGMKKLPYFMFDAEI